MVNDGAQNQNSRGAEQTRTPSTTAMSVAIMLLSSASFLVVLYVLWTARLLRPGADDYSLAISAKDGLFQGVWSWWQGWSGDVTAMFSNTLFVGMPLIHLPWSFASAIPFMSAAAVIVGAAGWILFHAIPKSGEKNRRLFILSSAIPILAITWWGYWWLPVLQARDTPNADPLAQGITHWQNLNSGYVITTALLIWAWFILESRKTDKCWLLWTGYAILGLLAGLNGPVFAGSAVAMIIILAAGSLLGSQVAIRTHGATWLLAVSGILVGALASHFSPGSQSRKLLLVNPEIDTSLFFRVVNEAVPGGLADWWPAVTSPGAWVLVVVIAGATALITLRGFVPNVNFLLSTGTGLLVFSLISSFVNRVSEFFAYPAFWHLTTPRAIAWLGLTTLAIAIGSIIARMGRGSLAVPVITFAAAAGVILMASSIALMSQEIINRSAQWEIGPAPVSGVSDIEEPDGWQRDAWLSLIEIREAPKRGIELP